MWDLAFKNITRQRTRTFLTVLGIIIGIAAIVALGSISEGLSNEVSKSLELAAGKIIVSESGGGLLSMISGDLTNDNIEEVESVSGVKEVIALQYYMEGLGAMQMPEWMLIGMEPENAVYFTGESIMIESGRELEEGDYEVIVIGKTVSENYNLEVGDFFTVKETDFEIVGVLEQSGITDIDTGMIAPLEVVQELLEKDTYPTLYVIPEDVSDVELVAERIEETNEDLAALTSTDIARQASEILDQIRLFTLGIGAIAALVGGLGIMNTMIMSVLERKKEIGVMKAVGATRKKILIHFLSESILLSAIGGIIGIVLGAVGSILIGLMIGFGSFAIVTPVLAIGAFLFAILLGLMGGFYPSWKAAKMDPVIALRYE